MLWLVVVGLVWFCSVVVGGEDVEEERWRGFPGRMISDDFAFGFVLVSVLPAGRRGGRRGRWR